MPFFRLVLGEGVLLGAAAGDIVGSVGGSYITIWFGGASVDVSIILLLVFVCVNTDVGGGGKRDGVRNILSNAVS
jgi:hypothetical protein